MRILQKTVLHRGAKFDFARHRLETSSGQIVQREFIDHPGSVVLIPIAPDGRIVMVHNFRHAIGRALLELPAGTSSPGEPPEATAVRELIEETGFRAARWERVFEMFPLPGATNEKMTFFRAFELSPGPPAPEVDEELETKLVSLDEALENIDRGVVCDGKSIVGLWLESRRPLDRASYETNPHVAGEGG